MSAEELDRQQPDSGAPARSAPPVKQAAAPATGSGWSYRGCREARAAGAAPLYRGQPGYGTHMDGDGDGIACEPYHGG
ncbi:calcium-binding protein [Sphingobium sp. CAP-1]|nr:calcium-binding protein [Sphingobium sp. CAP-1]